MSSQASAVKVLEEEIEKDKRWIETCLSIKPKDVYFHEQYQWDAPNTQFKRVPHLLTPVSYNKESIRFKILACDDEPTHIRTRGRRLSTDITYFYNSFGEKETKFKLVPRDELPLYMGYKFVDPSLTKFLSKSK